MKRFFGAKKEEKQGPTLEQASTSIGGRVSALDEKIKGLDAELRVHKEKLKTAKGPAKTTLSKRAMDVLKRKKMYETQRDQLVGQQFNIDQAGFAIESARDTVTTIGAMKAAGAQLKKQYKEINIDQIDDITDELADMMEDMNEVNEALGRSYGVPDDIDEADLEAELDLLEDEVAAEAVAAKEGAGSVGAGATPSYLQPNAMPAVPAGTPVAVGGGGEDDFGLPVAPQAN